MTARKPAAVRCIELLIETPEGMTVMEMAAVIGCKTASLSAAMSQLARMGGWGLYSAQLPNVSGRPNLYYVDKDAAQKAVASGASPFANRDARLTASTPRTLARKTQAKPVPPKRARPAKVKRGRPPLIPDTPFKTQWQPGSLYAGGQA